MLKYPTITPNKPAIKPKIGFINCSQVSTDAAQLPCVIKKESTGLLVIVVNIWFVCSIIIHQVIIIYYSSININNKSKSAISCNIYLHL